MGDGRFLVSFFRKVSLAIASAAVALCLVLGCGGLVEPQAPPAPAVVPPVIAAVEPGAASAAPAAEEPTGADPAWVAEAVAEALDWEVMPGTTEEPDDGKRAAQLRVFFLAHPEYADATRRSGLAADACAISTEAAHERLVSPPTKVALEIAVESDNWRILVAHAAVLCTSDDWSYYTNEVDVGVTAKGAQYAYAGAEHDVIVVRRAGVEVARIPLQGQGYVVAANGRAPLELEHNMADAVIEAAGAYFGGPP